MYYVAADMCYHILYTVSSSFNQLMSEHVCVQYDANEPTNLPRMTTKQVPRCPIHFSYSDCILVKTGPQVLHARAAAGHGEGKPWSDHGGGDRKACQTGWD
jgi:hypothetical protein